ncbi:DUF3850 domain-containing protein [Enterococcus hulanensis]|uniref:DUF3850 domain-containing protein n=1 Tax=Enterococcus hulanensis TaxID=2559929 RepID=UPI001A900807|nr:DUF3850 domain-containing protein [Enterococcus hulanensis]MBO0456313.1 DUF3850 domain-containing protein [Enterococcus hulanensis]
MIHELKILPEYFAAILSRKKTFEIRKNDRGFQEGDTVILKNYTKKDGYSGDYAKAKITYVTDFAQKTGFVVFAIKLECSGFDYKYKKEKS